VFGIVNDHVRLVLRDRTLGLQRVDGGPIPSRYVDYALAACVFRMTWIVGHPVPVRARLRRSAPADPAGHRRAFGPDLTFEAAADEAEFSDELWATPTRSPDPLLREVLQSHGRAELARVARALDTSARTLQRRLAGQGVTWSALVEETRRDLARAYLLDRSLSLEEVALLVGYADPSGFHRAFARWTGQTPGGWRETH
jgi:AraC-like DNA-binding protein